MRVLHGMCYSLPAVVMISYLMWLTNSWASGIALTNLLTVHMPNINPEFLLVHKMDNVNVDY